MFLFNINKDILDLSKFIDFDRNQNIFYENVYLKDCDFVIKIPLLRKEYIRDRIKIEKFNLAKYIYLLDHE